MTKFYYLNCTAEETVDVTVLLNGFPLHKGVLYKGTETPFLLNLYLVAGSNNLEFQIFKPSSEQVQDYPYALETSIDANVKVFEEGQVVTPEDGEKLSLQALAIDGQLLPAEQEVSLKLHAFAKQTAAYQFTQAQFDFSRLLKAPSVSVPEETLVKYGHYLRQLFRQRNVEQFMVEYQNKISDLALAHGQPANAIAPQMAELMRESMALGLTPDEQLEPVDLEVVSWCGGAIYELMVKPGKDLIETKESEEGAESVAVFVAVISGALKVVR